jgi:putative ABC transport system substrate-binding protein
LVRLQVVVIAAFGGSVSARAAKAATATIPIVISIGEDPVESGCVQILNRPEGNITGVMLFTSVLGSCVTSIADPNGGAQLYER